jgi:endonuclease/exonuclease/phosphatase family metal-dependent hydrolase
VTRPIRVATYNIHKCKGMDQRVRPLRILEVLREVQPDVVGLQEVLSIEDGPRELNQAQFLADGLEMHLAMGENRRIRGGSYGNVVLSRFPVRSFCNYNVSVIGREPRGCLRTDVYLPDESVLHFFNVHFGTGFMERRHQARMLAEQELIRSHDLQGPRVVAGDFNEWTSGLLSRVLRAEFESADIRLHLRRTRTYPGWLPIMHLDHIYYDHDLVIDRVALHRTKRSLVASDHLPLVADFWVRQDLDRLTQDSAESTPDVTPRP